MRKRKIFLFVVLATAVTMILSGCNEELQNKNIVLSEIERIMPDAKLVQIESDEDENLYTFRNGSFDFTYRDYIYKDSMFGVLVNGSDCDYLEALVHFKEDEIAELAEKYNISIIDKVTSFESNMSSEELALLIKENDISLRTNPYDRLEFFIDGYNDIKYVFGFIEEITTTLHDYLPKAESEVYTEEIHFTISYEEDYKGVDAYNADGIYWFDIPFVQNAGDYELEKAWTEYQYEEAVVNSLIFDTDVDTDNHKPQKLDKLYIDGERFVSDRYSTEFIYNIEDDKYYTIVCFGMQFDYNGGVDDYLQREIIEKYYEDADYTIYDGSDSTTYSIGKNKYLMKWTHNGLLGSTDQLLFFRNQKQLDIETYDKLGLISTGASYNVFISVDDFAEIMEMKVDLVDLENGALHLSSD